MSSDPRVAHDPVAVLRGAWKDTGWRTVIIAAPLIFLLEALMEVAGNPGGTGLLWTAMLITLLVICRALTLRPPRGGLADVENLTVLVAIAGILMIQAVYAFTTVGATFIAEPIFWPFALISIGILVASRIAAPYLSHQLNIWLSLLLFLYLWMTIATWTAQASFPEPPFTWSVALVGFALIARWVAGRGFSGPLASPLNLATGLFVLMMLWAEYAFQISGVGADPFGRQELYWPFLLIIGGIALGGRLVAPVISARRGAAD